MRGPRHRARTRTAPGSRELPRVLARGLIKREALYLLGRRACATRRRLPARPATESVRGRGGGMMSRQRVDPCRLATALPTRSTIRLRGAQPRRGRPVHNPRSYGRARHHRSDARLCGLRRHRLEADRRLRSPCLADIAECIALSCLHRIGGNIRENLISAVRGQRWASIPAFTRAVNRPRPSAVLAGVFLPSIVVT